MKEERNIGLIRLVLLVLLGVLCVPFALTKV